MYGLSMKAGDRNLLISAADGLTRGFYFLGPYGSKTPRQAPGAIYMQSCPSCIEEQIGEFGFATWNIVHQVPMVRFCHIHALALTDACHTCGHRHRKIRFNALPSDVCAICNSHPMGRLNPEPAPSLGEIDFSRDCAQQFHSDDADIHTEVWERIICSVTQALGDSETAIKVISQEIEYAWRSRDATPSSPTAFGIRPNYIEEELYRNPTRDCFFGRMVVLGSIRRLGYLTAALKDRPAEPEFEYWRAFHRKKVSDAWSSGSMSNAERRLLCPTSFRWLRKNDRQWIRITTMA
jgi:hypothetical protein